LATKKRHTHLFNSDGATHSLGHEKHKSTTFWFKNNKYIVKIPKLPHGPLNYTNTHSKISKYPQRQSFFFVFSDVKNIIWLYLKILKKSLNTLIKKSRRKIYFLAKKWEIESDILLQSTVKTILIYNNFSTPSNFCYNLLSCGCIIELRMYRACCVFYFNV